MSCVISSRLAELDRSALMQHYSTTGYRIEHHVNDGTFRIDSPMQLR